MSSNQTKPTMDSLSSRKSVAKKTDQNTLISKPALSKKQITPPTPIKQPIKLKSAKKGCFSFRNCCLSLVALFLVVILFISFTIAASGLVQIPLLTKLLYKDPTPTRYVSHNLAKADVQKKVQDIIDYGEKDNLEIELSEQEMTALVQGSGFNQNSTKVENGQIVIEPGYLEYFGQIPTTGNNQPAFLVRFQPQFVAGKMKPKVIYFKIGRVIVPNFLINLMMGNLGSEFASYFSSPNDLNINAVTLGQGKMIIKSQATKYLNPSSSVQSAITPTALPTESSI